MPPNLSAQGAAAALALTRKKRVAGKAKISKTALQPSDPVLAKREQLQQEHDRLLALMARLPAQGSASSSMAADESFATSDVPHVTQMITIRQPFASGIMAGKKQVENRTWGLKLRDDGTGTWLGVHAGAGYAKGSAFLPSIAALQRAWPEMPPPDSLPRGAILGVMHVKAVLPVDDVSGDPQAFGPVCWVIDRALPLEQPIAHVKGARALWRVPEGLFHRSYVRQGKIVTLPPNSVAREWTAVYEATNEGGAGSEAKSSR